MKKFGAFVLGGVVGAAAALLTAPRPGDETRAIVTDWANNALGDKVDLNERIEVRRAQITHDAGIVANQAANLASAGIEKAKDVVAGAQAQVPNLGKQEAESDAELRARIEQARARIANQVAENAARASEAAGAAIPGVQEAVKGVAAQAQETVASAAAAVKGAAKKEDAPAEEAPKAEQ